MTRVVIEGWKAGLNKTALDKLLRDRAHKSLKQSKQCVDRVLEGHAVVVFDGPDAEQANNLADAITALGATCRVEEIAGSASVS